MATAKCNYNAIPLWGSEDFVSTPTLCFVRSSFGVAC